MSTFQVIEPPVPATPAADYSTVYGNISSYLNQVSQELTDIDTDTTSLAVTLALIATSLSTMATNSTTVAQKLSEIERLSKTTGIRIRGPFESISNVSIYKLLIEQARILDTEGVASAELQTQAKTKAAEYINKINSEFKEF